MSRTASRALHSNSTGSRPGRDRIQSVLRFFLRAVLDFAAQLIAARRQLPQLPADVALKSVPNVLFTALS